MEMVSPCGPSNLIAKTGSFGQGSARMMAMAYSGTLASNVTTTLSSPDTCDSVQIGSGVNSHAQTGDAETQRQMMSHRMAVEVAVHARKATSHPPSEAAEGRPCRPNADWQPQSKPVNRKAVEPSRRRL
ncbi:MAG: hypothetical protein AAF074_07020 [Pseudomonadota bacterium]